MSTNYIRRQFAGGAVKTTLSGGIGSTATSIGITASTGWPDGSVGPFIICINRGNANEEKVLVTSRSGTTLTTALAQRGYDNTTGAAHVAGETVEVTGSAQDGDEANQAVVATLGAVTTKGDLLVGTGANALGKLGVGANNTLLVSDNTQPTGLRWGALDATAGDYTTLVFGGSAAAGSVGKPADAGHSHGMPANPFARPMAVEHTWSVSGAIAVPSAGTNFLPPMFASVPASSSKKLRAVRYVIRAGTSVTFNFQQNGSTVTSLSGLSATTTAASTSANTGTPVAVADNDTFAPVVTAVSGSPDGLTITAYFDVIP